MLSYSSKSAFSFSNIFRVFVLFEGQSDSNLQHFSKLFTILRFRFTPSRLNHLILQAFSEELNSPLSETQPTKSPWKEPQDVEEKKQCPRCFESGRTKIQNYYTSFKSYLVKNDLSYFIEMSSRVFFPLTYMAFIAYFFGTYGIWKGVLLNVFMLAWICYINWSSKDFICRNFSKTVHHWTRCGCLSEMVGDLRLTLIPK